MISLGAPFFVGGADRIRTCERLLQRYLISSEALSATQTRHQAKVTVTQLPTHYSV